MSIIPEKATLTVTPTVGKPDVKIHPGQWPTGHIKTDIGKGLRGIGRVRMRVDPGENLNGWTAGFVQVLRLRTTQARYLGRFSGEGSIICQLERVLPKDKEGRLKRVYVDSLNKGLVPFYKAGIAFNRLEAAPEMSDHPWAKIPVMLENRETTIDNFLFDYRENVDFWTILAVKNVHNALSYLAHFRWHVKTQVAIIWRGGVPLKIGRTHV